MARTTTAPYPLVPLSARRGHRSARAAPPAALALAAGLTGLWVILYPRTPDLAAQVYRVGLYHQLGFVVWDEHWYAGHHLPGYSLLFPPLGALLGLRLLGALSVLASTALFGAITWPIYGTAARWGTAWFAVAALGDVWAGRLTFALGVSFALAGVLAFQRGRAWAAVPLALLCATASPVAGALLALAAVTISLAEHSPRALLTLALPALAAVLCLALLFPEGGSEPYPVLSFAATAVVVVLFLLALPPTAHTLRLGGGLYLLVCLLCLLASTPVGSNIERYGVLLAGPLLLCELLGGGRENGRRRLGSVLAEGTGGARRSGHGSIGPIGALALCAAAVWTLWGPVRETLATAGSEATSAAYYLPVEEFLQSRRAQGPVRVEVPLTRSHWEAALLAPRVSLARGWEKQLDTRFDHVLLAHGLTAPAYDAWLHQQAVAYVALPDVPLDPSSAREGRLIHAGLPFLREVFRTAHWRIYRVLAPTPIVSGPGRLTSLGHDTVGLFAASPGSLLVRVHFTRYWTLARGRGCVVPAPGGWTEVRLSAPGEVVLAARFSLARAFDPDGSCGGVRAG